MPTSCPFVEEISTTIPTKVYTENTVPHTFETENILIALFPPQIKPNNNFGISAQTAALIKAISTSKNVTLYLFGNPYSLRILDTESIANSILVYQDFESFQHIAAQHFLGKHTAIGKLPVKL